MTYDVIEFIKECKGDGMEAVASRPDLPVILSKIERQMATLPDNEQLEIRSVLVQLMGHVENHIHGLSKKMKKSRDDMDRVRNSSEACIAYLESAKKGSGKRER